jgi:hypothetical protein
VNTYKLIYSTGEVISESFTSELSIWILGATIYFEGNNYKIRNITYDIDSNLRILTVED